VLSDDSAVIKLANMDWQSSMGLYHHQPQDEADVNDDQNEEDFYGEDNTDTTAGAAEEGVGRSAPMA
jgi:hypothetical protein